MSSMSIRAHGGSKCAKQGINQLNQPTNYKMYIKAATRTYYSMQKNKKGSATKTTTTKNTAIWHLTPMKTHNWSIS